MANEKKLEERLKRTLKTNERMAKRIEKLTKENNCFREKENLYKEKMEHIENTKKEFERMIGELHQLKTEYENSIHDSKKSFAKFRRLTK